MAGKKKQSTQNKITAASKATGTPEIKASYDAVKSTARRAIKKVDTRTDDKLLKGPDRDKLISNARNLRRNCAEVAWMIRKHCDYVSDFRFQCRTGNTDLDTLIEEYIERWSLSENCDVTGRFSLAKLMRIGEGLRTVDGDYLWLKIEKGTDRGKLQLVEADRIRTPSTIPAKFTKIKPEDFVNGVRADETGKPLSFALCRRVGDNGYELAQVLPAKAVIHSGYFDRYDQLRGISPLASSMNNFFDLHEAKEFALAKMKASQILALKLKRGGTPDPNDEGTAFTFGEGPQVLDLDPEDDASFLESANPSMQFQSFFQTNLISSLKGLDIPFSFYDESFTNYSGSRSAAQFYEQSAKTKRRENQNVLNTLVRWRLGLAVEDGELSLPDGITVDDLSWEWVGVGMPWFDGLKEAQADVLLVNNRMASRQQLAKARGTDWFVTIDQLAEEEEYLKSKGLRVTPTEVIEVPAELPEEQQPVHEEERNAA